MAKKQNEQRERRWMKPSKRAKGYLEERKNKVRMFGDREGQELTDYDKGVHAGYFRCLSDNAGIYKYSKARKEGKSAQEAAEISRKIGK